MGANRLAFWKRVALVLIALGGGLLLLVLLVYGGLRTSGGQPTPSADAGALSDVAAPLATPPLAEADVDAPTGLPVTGTVPADKVEKPESQPDAAAGDRGVVVLVDEIPIELAALQAALAIDRAMGALLGTPSVGDPAAALERLINGELVRQAARRDGFAVDQSTVDQALATILASAGRTVEDLDRALAAVGMTQEDFREYFGRLVRIDRYSQEQAQARQILAADYVQQLQESARISFGPAAAEAIGLAPAGELALADTGAEIASPADQLAAAAPTGQPANSQEAEPEQPPPTLVADRDEVSMASTVDVATVTPLGPRGTAIGDFAPSFDLPALNPAPADNLSLDGLLGSPALLSFWTTWCPYCQRQTPVLVDASQADTSQGIQFVGINVAEQPGVVREYVANQGIPYPIALDEGGEVADRYGVLGYPTTFFLDEAGQVVAQHVGALSAVELAGYLQQLR